MARVLIAVPVGSRPMEPACFEALWKLDRCGHEVYFRIVEGYDCARVRNAIAQMSLDFCCDKVLMVDSDIVVPPDALANLMEGDAPIVLGCYRRKDDTGRAELFAAGDDLYRDNLMWGELPAGRFEVSGGGFGCAMVDVGAFRKLVRPYFAYPEYTNGGFLSEDFFFCEKARARGLRIEADGRVRCKHVGRFVWE